VIERSANQQRLLIEELLDLSRATANASMETFSNITVNDVLRNVADAAQPTAAERKVQLVVGLALHPMVIRGDARRLHQIFGNLVSNAIKFTQASGTVRLLSRSGCEAVAEVADTGVGISACELPRIFEPFWRADAACRLSHEGLGLGLAIVRRFVEHAIERAVIVARGSAIRLRELPPEIWQTNQLEPTGVTLDLRVNERDMIGRALRRFHGSRREAAEALKISTVTLWRAIKSYGIDV
jgi:K+-sensing histidine kinase KdpD